jgi:hypothetical protein
MCKYYKVEIYVEGVHLSAEIYEFVNMNFELELDHIIADLKAYYNK